MWIWMFRWGERRPNHKWILDEKKDWLQTRINKLTANLCEWCCCCQVLISSTLNAQFFCTKVLSAAFSTYVLALTNVWKHKSTFIRKICVLNVYEIDNRCQFHQHFTCTFFADILAPKKFKPKTQLCNFWRKNIGATWARKMLMKLTTGVNFINILLEPFLYKSVLHRFSLVTVLLWKFLLQ